MTTSDVADASVLPTRLAVNTPRRFYRGGERILAFRGLPLPDDFDGYRPEDWLASATHLFAEGGGGVTRLASGAALPEALAANPVGWLGAAHVAAYGVAPGLLTKLLDSGERLPVHSHPDRAFAARHLDCDNGKTEAWIVLEAEPGASVWLGFREELPLDELAELVEAQDDRLLASLNRIEVARGDAILVPAGQPHAIGEGVLILELQEPTDLSVMLEHARFGLDEAHAFLGLERPLALQSVDRRPLTTEAIGALRRRWTDVAGAGPALPVESREFFRAQVVRPTGPDPNNGTTEPVTVEAAFAVTVVVDGRGTLATEVGDAGDGVTLDIERGDVLLVPHGAGGVRIEGDVTVIRCMPPAGNPVG